MALNMSCFVFISFCFFSLFQFSSARNSPPSDRPRIGSAEWLIKGFNLFPKHDVNLVVKEDDVSVPEIVERPIDLLAAVNAATTDAGDGTPTTSLTEFGHHAGYYKLPHSKAARMFYFFFESRGNKSDPMVIWLTGGPGCSGSIAMFYENGPFHLTNNMDLVWNQFGWDKVSNIIFVDQPVGTGFSYTSDETDFRRDETGVSNDLYDFLQLFFKNHPQFAQNDFYITGESYAGHYVPALASRVNQGNKAKEGIHINLKGFAIGNGLTNPKIQYPAYPDYAVDMKLIKQSDYQDLSVMIPDCIKSIQDCESDSSGEGSCENAFNDCTPIEERTLQAARPGLNVYDIRKKCVGRLCYDFSAMETFLNRRSVKDALGVGNIDFVSCSTTVYDNMYGDWMKNLEAGIPELLETGIKVLIYAGEYDFICNWLGNWRWVNAMKWSGSKEFGLAPNVTFQVDGKVAGLLKTHGPLSFLKVHDAGHMVPMDQPKAALQMLVNWMQGKPLSE